MTVSTGLEKFVRTWWKHTEKAVRRGEPESRRFAVAGVVEDEGRKYLLAWKVEDLGGGRVWHPAYGEVELVSVDPFILRGQNGSEPTAMFRPDSLYVLCV